MSHVPERLLTTGETVLEDNRRNNAAGAREAVNNRSNSAGGAREAVNNRSGSAGGARKVVYNMRFFLFSCIMESQMKLLMHYAICDFVKK